MIRGKGCNLMVMMGWGLSELCLSVLINPVHKVRNQIEKEAYRLLSERASQEIFPKPGQGREVRSTSCLLSFLSSFRLKQKRLTASQHSLLGAKLGTSNASLGILRSQGCQHPGFLCFTASFASPSKQKRQGANARMVPTSPLCPE